MECGISSESCFREELQKAMRDIIFKANGAPVPSCRVPEVIRLKVIEDLESSKLLRGPRTHWHPVSPCGQKETYLHLIDPSPSITFSKNPLTMGIFDTRGIKPPHESGGKGWAPASRRRSYFSVPPRFEWTRSFCSLRERLTSGVRARSDWVGSGQLPSRKVAS